MDDEESKWPPEENEYFCFEENRHQTNELSSESHGINTGNKD